MESAVRALMAQLDDLEQQLILCGSSRSDERKVHLQKADALRQQFRAALVEALAKAGL